MGFIRTGKQIILFCSILIFLFLISPACACTRFTFYVLTVPDTVLFWSTVVLAVSALLYVRRRTITILVIIGSLAALYFVMTSVTLGWQAEVGLLLLLPVMAGLNIAWMILEKGEQRYRKIISGAVIGLVVLVIGSCLYNVGTGRLFFASTSDNCESNLRTIGTYVEMYSTDHRNQYPDTLSQLTPNYLKKIPRCFKYKVNEKTKNYIEKTYKTKIDEYRYAVSSDHKRYTIWCTGSIHNIGTDLQGFPQYNNKGLWADPHSP